MDIRSKIIRYENEKPRIMSASSTFADTKPVDLLDLDCRSQSRITTSQDDVQQVIDVIGRGEGAQDFHHEKPSQDVGSSSPVAIAEPAASISTAAASFEGESIVHLKHI